MTTTFPQYTPPSGGGVPGSEWYAPVGTTPATLPTAAGLRAISAGSGAVGSGTDGIAFGTGALASDTATTAVGSGAAARRIYGVALGAASSVGGGATGAIVIGAGLTTSEYALVIGYAAQVTATRGVAIGDYANVSSALGQAIGGFTYIATTTQGFDPAAAVALGAVSIPNQSGEVASALVGTAAPYYLLTYGHDRRVKATQATTDATATLMTIQKTVAGMGFKIPDSSSATVYGKIAAYQTAGGAGTVGDSAGWDFSATIKKVGAGNTYALVGAVVVVNALGADAGAALWTATVAVNATNGLEITVTGEANKTISWFATVDMANTV